MHGEPASTRGKIADRGARANPSRRNFLRKAGLMGAVAAALTGGAEVVGLTPASAAGRTNCTCYGACTRASCHCYGDAHAGSDGCCKSGYCCYECTTTHGCGGIGSYTICISRSASHCDTHYTYCLKA